MTAPRIRAAIEQDGLQAGFLFEAMGRQPNRDAILELEREAIANLIVQTDATGKGRGITKIAGHYIIGSNPRQEVICLLEGPPRQHRDPRGPRDDVRGGVQPRPRAPAERLRLTCDVGESDSFRFCQIPDEILAALQLDEDPRAPTTS